MLTHFTFLCRYCQGLLAAAFEHTVQMDSETEHVPLLSIGAAKFLYGSLQS